VAILIGLAVVAALAATFGHYDCHHVQAGISSPEAGTPRADYCSATDAGAGWMMFAVPVVLAGLGFMIVRGRRDRVLLIGTGFALMSIVNAVLIMFLSPEYTHI
jgi:hypothetical protein